MRKRQSINVHLIAGILISLDWTSQTPKLKYWLSNIERKVILMLRGGNSDRTKILVVTVLVAAITLLHYRTPLSLSFSHELFARLYYLPIFLGGFWFGLRGGIGVPVVVTLLYFPHLWMGWGESGFVFWNKVLEVILFNLFGPIVGILTQMELRQRARNQELQTLASMGEAAAFVAHEIKNIVIPVRGFLRLLRQTSPMDGKAESYIEIAQSESARLENLAKNMLTFGRRAPIQREPIAVEALLSDACHTLSEEFKEKGVELICNCHEGIGEAYLDSEMIRQAIINLLQNALHASPEKGGKVRLKAERGRKLLRVVIKDEGDGIPEHCIEKIFLPFFTTKPKGTGLGLAIARKVAREHGGDISIRSTRGKGTKVSLELPLLCVETFPNKENSSYP